MLVDTTSQKIGDSEWLKIFDVEDVRDAWGLHDMSDPERLEYARDLIYGVRFDFVSGSPGYVGDLFILQGDALGEPMTLIRDFETKKLESC